MAESIDETLIRNLVDLYQQFPQVEALALAGSRVSGIAPDAGSDVDLCVFTTGLITPEARAALVEALGGASRANLNHAYWGLCDEWVHRPSRIGVDVVYWDAAWVESLLDRVINQHHPSLGYTTAHWFTIRNARPLFDRNGWFARLQEWSRQPYPEELRQAVVTSNLAVLREMISSYRSQVAKAVQRKDLVSLNHRVAGLLASYFDILFAQNRLLHPGEKRLLEQAVRLCPSLPENMAEDVTAVLLAAADPRGAIVEAIDRLVDHLETWL